MIAAKAILFLAIVTAIFSFGFFVGYVQGWNNGVDEAESDPDYF